MKSLKVGFVGLGNMGSAIAQRIINGGFPTILYAHDEKSIAPFRNQAVQIVNRLAELSASSDLIGVCVFDDKDVNEVMLGENGILENMKPEGIVAIHSTISVDTMLKLEAQGRKKSIYVIDATLSGRRQGALEGKLAVMVGGGPKEYERVKPLFETFGNSVALMGPVGSGQKAKALSNVMNFANLSIAAEGLKIGLELGLNVEALKSVLPGGGAGSFALDSLLTSLLPNPSFAPHAAKMIEKDTGLYQAMCAKLGLGKTMIDTNAERAFEIVSKELRTLV